MSIIDLINSTISKALNKEGYNYKAIVGDKSFTPQSVIVDSADYECGAIANELEYAKLQTQNLTDSINPSNAKSDLLDMVIMSLIDMPRRGSPETDTTYLTRFNMVVRQDTNTTRCTGGAMHDAVTELGLTDAQFHFYEMFGIKSRYFQLRLVGVDKVGIAVLFLDSMKQGYLDNNFMGGMGVGALQTYIMPLIRRIKTFGVRFDILIVLMPNITYTSNAKITA